MTSQPPITTDAVPGPDNGPRDNYLRALTALVGKLSTKQARSVHKASFAANYNVDLDTIRALVQLDCLEQARATPGNYRALTNLFHVTPEQVMERLAAMKSPPETQPQEVTTKAAADDKPAKAARPKRASTVTDSAVDIPDTLVADPPISGPSEAPQPVIDPTGTYLYNDQTNHIERVDGRPVHLGDVCEPAWKEFASTLFPKKGEKERVCVPYPSADALLSDDRKPVSNADFIQALYELKRLYLKASYAATELAGILSEIDDLERQPNQRL